MWRDVPAQHWRERPTRKNKRLANYVGPSKVLLRPFGGQQTFHSEDEERDTTRHTTTAGTGLLLSLAIVIEITMQQFPPPPAGGASRQLQDAPS
ncbi:hypothetical protein F5Y12DRAFT_718300 [Xylaria sp. FL1777]|nr:hypothetical protein F5Y12DRAFT_718300 [Xylaria sp. FL1777]